MLIWLILLCTFILLSFIGPLLYRKREQKRKQQQLLQRYKKAIECNKNIHDFV